MTVSLFCKNRRHNILTKLFVYNLTLPTLFFQVKKIIQAIADPVLLKFKYSGSEVGPLISKLSNNILKKVREYWDSILAIT